MEQGLAQQMVYGNGEGQTVTHFYAGVKKRKKCGDKACKCCTKCSKKKKK